MTTINVSSFVQVAPSDFISDEQSGGGSTEPQDAVSGLFTKWSSQKEGRKLAVKAIVKLRRFYYYKWELSRIFKHRENWTNH